MATVAAGGSVAWKTQGQAAALRQLVPGFLSPGLAAWSCARRAPVWMSLTVAAATGLCSCLAGAARAGEHGAEAGAHLHHHLWRQKLDQVRNQAAGLIGVEEGQRVPSALGVHRALEGARPQPPPLKHAPSSKEPGRDRIIEVAILTPPAPARWAGPN
jgi:hypothetical protein